MESPIMIQVEPSLQVQHRRACDKCHRGKTKCVRNSVDVDGPCRRCQQGGLECVSSPPSKSARHGKAQAQASSLIEKDIDMTGNEPRNLSANLPTTRPLHAPMPNVVLSTHPSIITPTDKSLPAVEPRVGDGGNTITHSTAAITDLGSWTAKVADLNIRMSRHLQSFPEVVPGDRITGYSVSAGEECAAFGIDKTMHLSQEFVDILSQTLDMIPPALGPWRRLAIEASEAPPNAVSLNAASELLMISTHLHHLEIYDRVFRHILASLSRARKESNASLPFAVPRLTIGSFSLSSRPETQLHFTVGLMESMLMRCRDLIGQVTAPRDTPGHRGGFECFGGVTMVIVPDLALQAMRTRETIILRLADEVKKNLKL